jgi:two-component system phosphate regulon sensor histidine kinase PhoR
MAIDTIPLYFANANDRMPFRFSDVSFRSALNLEMVAKLEYFFDDTASVPFMSNVVDDVNIKNFREKFASNEPIAVRYTTLVFDSILRDELHSFSIYDEFHFGYIRSDNNQLHFRTEGAHDKTLMKSPLRVRLTKDKYFSQPYDLVMYFNDYQAVLFAGIRTQLIISFLVILILLIGFYLFIRIIYRQRKLSELKNDFINNMTHEFKTPLANISIALENLAEKSLGEKEPNAKLYRILGQETERLRENIEKILQVARLEKEKIHLSFEKLDVHSVIQKAVSPFEPVLETRKASVEFVFNAAQPVIEADETHLINIICNLIDNSIKYSSNGLRLQFRTENTHHGIIFSVIDNGEGISKEAQKRIFEKFYRANNTDTHTVKGFGLGLVYVKTIVDSHKGKIVVKSQENSGSEFQIYLPFNQ